MKPSKTFGLVLAVVAFVLVGCHGEPRPRPPKASGKTVRPVPPEPPTLQNEDGAAPDRFAAKPSPAQPTVRLVAVRSHKPHPTKEQAIVDALTVARIELMKQLELLDPPVHARPSMVAMRHSFVKGEIREIVPTEEEKAAIRANNLNANVRWVELDLELSEGQVQQLRSSERVTDAFRVAALAFAFFAALYGFLRLDQWTKGYLTLWLGLGAGVLVVVVGLSVFS